MLAKKYESRISDRRLDPSSTGEQRRRYRGRHQDEELPPWITDEEVLDSFTPLQLNVFHAPWSRYRPFEPVDDPRGHISRRERSKTAALATFSIGTLVAKTFTGGRTLTGQVRDYYHPYWRVRYSDGHWEEVTRKEVRALAVDAEGQKT